MVRPNGLPSPQPIWHVHAVRSCLSIRTVIMLKKTNHSFDLCQDSGTGTAFFPQGRGAMLGTFVEVPCKDNWSGSEGGSLWGGSCMANDTTGLWPDVGCGNHGTNHPFACVVMQFWLIFTLRDPAPVSGWHEIWHDGTSCSYYGREVYGRRYTHGPR
jgi:hypothetical protein